MSSIVVPPRFYRSREWRRAREQALHRDGYRCTHRDGGRRCTATKRLHVHHRVAMVDGGDPFDLANLATLCPEHHREDRRGVAMRLGLTLEEWWAVLALAGGATAAPKWIETLVREAIADEFARQRAAAAERAPDSDLVREAGEFLGFES